MQATNPVVSVTDGEVSSEFVHNGVRVNMRYWLDCTTINYCYRLSNETNDTIPSVSLTPYLDPDLYFGSGGLSNDYGAASSARPKTLWAFDTGDDVTIPTSYVGIKTLGVDSYLNSWEVSSYSGQRSRIQTTNNGCTVLSNDINLNQSDIDIDNNFTTDRGYDTTLAIRYDVGPLEPGQESGEVCYGLQWGTGLPCSDEDQDDVCFSDDNCPTVYNPNQTDNDSNGVGDACDVIQPVEQDFDGITFVKIDSDQFVFGAEPSQQYRKR